MCFVKFRAFSAGLIVYNIVCHSIAELPQVCGASIALQTARQTKTDDSHCHLRPPPPGGGGGQAGALVLCMGTDEFYLLKNACPLNELNVKNQGHGCLSPDTVCLMNQLNVER